MAGDATPERNPTVFAQPQMSSLTRERSRKVGALVYLVRLQLLELDALKNRLMNPRLCILSFILFTI